MEMLVIKQSPAQPQACLPGLGHLARRTPRSGGGGSSAASVLVTASARPRRRLPIGPSTRSPVHLLWLLFGGHGVSEKLSSDHTAWFTDARAMSVSRVMPWLVLLSG